jgi:hypothetical protein
LLLPVRLKTAVEEDEDFFERPIDEVVEMIVTELRDLIKDKLQSVLHKNS